MDKLWLSRLASRRRFLGGMVLTGAAALTGCGWDGHFTFLGYDTHPQYDETIKTVYIPIFKNKAFQTTPHREMEMELTRAVMTQIQLKTPYKIINEPGRADTELLGTIVTFNKGLLNRTQQNEIREGELQVGVEIVWRDLRSGKILTNPTKPMGAIPQDQLVPFDGDNPPLKDGGDRSQPVLVRAPGRFLVEVGESNASAQTRLCNILAVEIANLMEKPWKLRARQPENVPLPPPQP